MTQTTTQPKTTNTPGRLTEQQIRDLVDQLAAAAGVLRPAVAFLPWLDDTTAVIQTAYRPGRRSHRARIDIARPALDELSPAAWRYLLAHEIGHLKLHHSRAVAFVEDTLEVIGGAFALAAIAWFALRDQSVGILTAGIAAAVLASMARYGWHLRSQLQADRYAARIAGLDHATIDEIWTHLERRAGMTLGERYLRHRLHHLVDQADDNHVTGTELLTVPGRGSILADGSAPVSSQATQVDEERITDGLPDRGTTGDLSALLEAVKAREESEWAERDRVTHIDTNLLHGDRQFTINLSSDGYQSVTFSHIPGGARPNVIVVDSHPRYCRTELTIEDIDRLLVQLAVLASGLGLPPQTGR